MYKQWINRNITLEVYNECRTKLKQQAKEMEKNQHRSTAHIFESEGFERCYYHSNHGSLNFDKYYDETYGGNKWFTG